MPAAPGQTPRAIQGGWGVGIPQNVDPAKRNAAWRALTWVTNKRINRYSIEAYQIDANRTSAFQDPALREQFPYLEHSLSAIENAVTIPTSRIPEFFQMNAQMNIEFKRGAHRRAGRQDRVRQRAGPVGGGSSQGGSPGMTGWGRSRTSCPIAG